MMGGFNEQRLADGSITKLCVENTNVRVSMRNWREEEEILVFNDAIGLEAYGIANASLSHGAESTDDPLLGRSCVVCEEDPKDFRCFTFFSAWTDTPILKIVARSFESAKP
jgi:hypothetical protein